MKVFLLTKEGPRRKAHVPYVGAAFALADGKCPQCGTDEPGPALKGFKVAGTGRRPSEIMRANVAAAIAAWRVVDAARAQAHAQTNRIIDGDQETADCLRGVESAVYALLKVLRAKELR